MIRLCAAVIVPLLFGSSAVATEPEANRVEIRSIRVGFAGRYKAGVWTPVEVEIRGAGHAVSGRVVFTTADGDGVASRVVAPAQGACHVLEGKPARVRAYVRFGRVKSDLSVEFRCADKPLARRVFRSGVVGDPDSLPPALLCGEQLVVVLGMPAATIEEAISFLEQQPGEKTVVAHLDDLTQLPDQWFGYEGVRTVVVGTGDAAIGKRGLTPRQVAALEEWITMGGRLVLSVGSGADAALRAGAPWARFAPGRLDAMVTLRQLGALEAYAGSSVAIAGTQSARPELRAPLLAEVAGVVEAREANLPLVVRRAYGFGQVVFAAFDLQSPVLADWQDRGLLVGKLLDLPTARYEATDESRAVMHYGFADMAGQLRSALDDFRGVRLVPFWLVVAMVIVYLAALGPGDYFFLRRFVQHMQWTWVTFPAIILAFSAAAWWLGGWLSAEHVLVNQADVVDVDVQTGRLRGAAWANVFSPQTDLFDFSFRPKSLRGPALAGATTLIGWLGLPGGGLGGMDPKTADAGAWNTRYDFAPQLDRLVGVPIQVRSTKSLTARWTAPADAYPKAQLHDEDRLPVGTITNSLPVALTECLLAYGTWAYELGTLEPGETVQVGPMLRRRELRSLLTGRRMFFDKEQADKFHEEVTPYDPASTDLAYILRAMMFFEMAGGRRYTGLLNRYQEFVDLSDLLKTDRAILVATAVGADGTERPGAELLRDGRLLNDPRNRHKTVYRFVFPVKAGQ